MPHRRIKARRTANRKRKEASTVATQRNHSPGSQASSQKEPSDLVEDDRETRIKEQSADSDSAIEGDEGESDYTEENGCEEYSEEGTDEYSEDLSFEETDNLDSEISEKAECSESQLSHQQKKFKPSGETSPPSDVKSAEKDKTGEGSKHRWAGEQIAKDNSGISTGKLIVTLKRLTISDDQSTGSAFKGRILSALQPRDLRLRGTHQKGIEYTNRFDVNDLRTMENFNASQPSAASLPSTAQGLQLSKNAATESFDRTVSALVVNKIALTKGKAVVPDGTSSVSFENVSISTDSEEGTISGAPLSEVRDLQDYILNLQKKAKAFDDLQMLREPRRHEVLYRLRHGKDVSIYFDRPVWVIGEKKRMLRSNLPLANLSSYLEKHHDLAFIVYKDFDVNELEVAKSRTTSSENSDNDIILEVPNTYESISPVSQDLHGAVAALLHSRPEFSDLLSWYQDKSLLPAPYLAIYHSRCTMNDLMQNLSESCRKQLSLLLEYVFSVYGGEYAAADDLLSRGKVSLPYVKYLFKPNDILVVKKGDDVEGFVSKSWPLNTRVRDSKCSSSLYSDPHSFKGPPRTVYRTWEIQAWSWKFDGTFYRENADLTLELDENDSAEQNITDLNIRPLTYVTRDVKELLKCRGETFWRCRFRHFVSYKENSGHDWQTSSDERYMIDLKTYQELHSDDKSNMYTRHARGRDSKAEELSSEVFEQDVPPEDNFLFLLPLTIKGYSLRRKKWFDLRADQIREVTWNKEAFKSLVLDRKTKDLIQALISNQLDAEKSTDLISGKGNGLVLLLHGGPGTGKTLTAESVAEIAEKPLYRVTCGDIGTEPDEVEKYLESVLNLGKIWGCVVLLDEADVFLEQRSLEDLLRNALVSVFLRVLEYYDGILVLTSNRVGTFDEAFKSRIQLALHYDSLGPFQRLKIWENFIVRLESLGEDMIDFDDLKDHLEQLAEHKMNGRQIRNAITTARQYAQWKRTVLTYSHLKDVIEISGRFDLYLDKLHGGYTQDQLAEDEGLRLSQAP
jgi:hypothetical protein